MSKTQMAESTTAEPAVVGETAPQLTLTEFCTRLSETVRRTELISGFEFSMRKAGALKDTAEAYQARFDAFVTTPV